MEFYFQRTLCMSGCGQLHSAGDAAGEFILPKFEIYNHARSCLKSCKTMRAMQQCNAR